MVGLLWRVIRSHHESWSYCLWIVNCYHGGSPSTLFFIFLPMTGTKKLPDIDRWMGVGLHILECRWPFFRMFTVSKVWQFFFSQIAILSITLLLPLSSCRWESVIDPVVVRFSLFSLSGENIIFGKEEPQMFLNWWKENVPRNTYHLALVKRQNLPFSKTLDDNFFSLSLYFFCL